MNEVQRSRRCWQPWFTYDLKLTVTTWKHQDLLSNQSLLQEKKNRKNQLIIYLQEVNLLFDSHERTEPSLGTVDMLFTAETDS